MKNAALQQKIVDYENLKNEVEQLRELAGVQKLSEDYKGVGATVIARDATEQYFSLHWIKALSMESRNMIRL